MESHLLILMSILEIKDPDRTTYLEMLIPREKGNQVFLKNK